MNMHTVDKHNLGLDDAIRSGPVVLLRDLESVLDSKSKFVERQAGL